MYGARQALRGPALERFPTLQLLPGGWNHIPHNPPVMSDKITVTVD